MTCCKKEKKNNGVSSLRTFIISGTCTMTSWQNSVWTNSNQWLQLKVGLPTYHKSTENSSPPCPKILRLNHYTDSKEPAINKFTFVFICRSVLVPVYDSRKLLQWVVQTVPLAHPGSPYVYPGSRNRHGLLHGRYYQNPDRLLCGEK